MTKSKKSPPDSVNPDSRETQEKNLGGRPRYQIKYESLEQLCAWQCTGEECAAVLGCCYDTLDLNLKRDYEEQLKANNGEAPHGFANGFQEYFKQFSKKGKASLRQAQFREAIKNGNANLLKFLGKNYLDQTDQRYITHSLKELEEQPTAYLLERLAELEKKRQEQAASQLH